MRNVTSTTAEIALDRAETTTGSITTDEVIGYLVIEAGVSINSMMPMVTPSIFKRSAQTTTLLTTAPVSRSPYLRRRRSASQLKMHVTAATVAGFVSAKFQIRVSL